MRAFAIIPRFSTVDPQQLTVGTSAVALPTPNLKTPNAATGARPEYVLLQALSTNTAPITISTGTPTAGGSGLELIAGANLVLPSNRWESYKAISSSAAQKMNVFYAAGVE